MKTKLFFLIFTAIIFITSSYSKKDGNNVNVSRTFYSEASNDGIIINSPVKSLSDYYTGGNNYKEITIGWNTSGYSMRGFISFDVSRIFPLPGNKLVIDNAVLTVYEANTNLNPFANDQTILCYLVNYGTLDVSDYDGSVISNIGPIASAMGGVLTGFNLNVTSALNNYTGANPATKKFQFRLQSSNSSNVSHTGSLAQAMWNIFSGDQEPIAGNNYKPWLVIKYHYKKG